MSAIDPWELLKRANERNQKLAEALGASIGYMMNARISLETGETKASVIDLLSRGIETADKPRADFFKKHPELANLRKAEA